MKLSRALHVCVALASLHGFLATPYPCLAGISLPTIFGSHMVLQRNVEVPLWGTAEPNEKITVKFAEKAVAAEAGPDGNWTVKLPATPAGGPHKLVIEDSTGDNKITLTDVLFGEVWVCSGQSNMEMNLASCDTGMSDAAAADHPQMRLFTIPHTRAEQPASDCQGRWQACDSQTAPRFSATAYYFAAMVQKEIGVPMGMIHTSWGGTPAEAWTPRKALEAHPSLKQYAQGSSQLYNGMIAPLTRLPIAGFIWYQGEANVGRAALYHKLFSTMILSWREAWRREDLPFYFVQIAPYRYKTENGLACAELWESQLSTMKSVPNTGMAVITDSKSVTDIHPRNKRIAGERLARWALAKTYGKSDLVFSGPIYKEMQKEVQVDADKIRLTFDYVGGGLTTRDGKAPSNFEIAGEDQRFVPATAAIDGASVLVHSDSVSKPAAVRFAWHEEAEPNLINKEGLPASPFRTDDWKLVTAGKK